MKIGLLLNRKSDWVNLILANLAFIFTFYLAATWDSDTGGSDNYMHFRIAYYAFKYPELFFNTWGKPVFNIIAAPFAQLGFVGIKLLNCVLAAFTFLVTAQLLKNIKSKATWTGLVFIYAAPGYYAVINSCLTEIMFGFWLALSMLLAFQKRFLASAIFLGFIIWIRNEGFVVIVPFVLYYIIYKKWWSIPALLVGWLSITLAGLAYKNDFFWFYTDMPYTYADGAYGSGNFFHYIIKYEAIWGPVILVGIIAGTSAILFRWFKEKFNLRSTDFDVLLLVLAPILAYFFAHSYVWYAGTGGSMGLTRVMAITAPSAAVLIVYGLSRIKLPVMHSFNPLAIVFAGAALVWFNKNVPLKAPQDQIISSTLQAAKEFKDAGFAFNKVFYSSPAFIHELGVDPYDKKASNQYFWFEGFHILNEGDLLVWDAHHSPTEGKLDFETVMNEPSMKLVYLFHPKATFKVNGGRDFSVYAFIKTKPDQNRNNYELAEKINNQRHSHNLLSEIDETVLNDQLIYSKTLELNWNEIDEPVEWLKV
ncbi:MAG: hypothetical protein KDC92_16900, partial [Bacteroidetes bacterium]|nr:hypothetical protein [Bacteroidota bacterium]